VGNATVHYLEPSFLFRGEDAQDLFIIMEIENILKMYHRVLRTPMVERK